MEVYNWLTTRYTFAPCFFQWTLVEKGEERGNNSALDGIRRRIDFKLPKPESLSPEPGTYAVRFPILIDSHRNALAIVFFLACLKYRSEPNKPPTSLNKVIISRLSVSMYSVLSLACERVFGQIGYPPKPSTL